MTKLTEAEIERLCVVHERVGIAPLLDTVAAMIAARLAPIRALVEDPIEECEVHTRIADGCEECSVVDALHWYAGRLRAALDATEADLSASQDHDGAEGQGCTCRGMDEAPGCTHGAPRVHVHPPYEPTCNERRVNGQLRGACLNDDGSPR